MISDEPARERILSFASGKFLREGFAKISVDELTSELAISKKTFYKYFTSKEDLLTQIMDRLVAGIRTRFLTIIDSDRDFIEKLSQVMALLANELGRLSLPLQADLQRHAPHIWKRVEDFRRERITKNFASLLEQGMEEGFVRKDINKKIALLTFLGAVESIIRPSVLINESFSAREALQSIMAIFFRGILTEDAGDLLRELQHNKLSQSS